MAVAGEVGATDDDHEKGSVQASAFKAEETVKCSGGREEGESAWQVADEAWVCACGAPTHLTPSTNCTINYRQGNLKLRIDDGSTRSIERYGDVSVVFRAGNSLVQVLLVNVAHVPDLRYHLFSLHTLV